MDFLKRKKISIMNKYPIIIFGIGKNGIAVLEEINSRGSAKDFKLVAIDSSLENLKNCKLRSKIYMRYDNDLDELHPIGKFTAALRDKKVVIIVCYSGDPYVAALLTELLEFAGQTSSKKVYVLVAFPRKEKKERYQSMNRELTAAVKKYSNRYLIIPTDLLEIYIEKDSEKKNVLTYIQQLLRISLESFLHILSQLYLKERPDVDAVTQVFEQKGEMKFSFGYNSDTAFGEALWGPLITDRDLMAGSMPLLHIQSKTTLPDDIISQINQILHRFQLNAYSLNTFIETNEKLKAQMFVRFWLLE